MILKVKMRKLIDFSTQINWFHFEVRINWLFVKRIRVRKKKERTREREREREKREIPV
jgi:hypothetical protein